jgi:PAS domain S-box-containing protein
MSMLLDPDALPCPWLSVGADGRVLHCNAALRELLQGGAGADAAADLKGRHIDTLLTDGGRLQYYGYFLPMLRMHGRAREMALTLRGGDGRPLELLAHACAHPAPPRVAQRIDMVLLPMDERRRLDDGLLRLQRATELTPGMLFQYVREADGHGAFGYVSEVVRRLYGLVPAQLRESDQPWLERIHPGDRERVRRALHTVPQDGHIWRDRFRVLPTDGGGLRWHAVQATPGASSDGRVLWHGYVADVTEQRERELAVARQETAERASRAKSEFLARASHELRTPLNAILGFAQLLELESGGLGGPQRRQLSLIGESGRELLRLVDDMLEIARLEADRASLYPVTLQLQPLLARALELAGPAASAGGIALQLVDCAAALHVYADEARLLQVLGHLLSNAIQYNRPGGHVWLSARTEAPGRLCIDVKDDGVGLDPQQLAALFQPFNRLGAERSGVKGAGLGLTIVQRLLPLMEGDITVRSTPNIGSVFSVWLPSVPGEDAAAEPAAAAPAPAPPRSEAAPAQVQAGESAAVPAPPAEAASAAREVDVLYVEDNPVNALLMQTLFQMRPQWRLRVAMDGESGVAEALRAPPRLLLVDMHLPDISGFEVLARMREHAVLREVPAIVVSAAAMSSDIERAQAAGFAAYWTKPLDLQRMLGELDRLLG